MKYKFVETQGCTAFGFTVNDKDINDISKEEVNEIVDYLCQKMKEKLGENTMQLQDVVRSFIPDEYGSDKEACDQCGDTVHWDIWNL